MVETKIEKLKRKKQELNKKRKEIDSQIKEETKKERDKIAKSLGLKIMHLYHITTQSEALDLFKTLAEQKKGLKNE